MITDYKLTHIRIVSLTQCSKPRHTEVLQTSAVSVLKLLKLCSFTIVKVLWFIVKFTCP